MHYAEDLSLASQSMVYFLCDSQVKSSDMNPTHAIFTYPGRADKKFEALLQKE